MYLAKIRAENLFSWKSLDLGFEDKTAYSFVGENGAGKSSIFEIITWVLFKKTTKAHVKGNWGEKDGWGVLELSDDNFYYIIKRETKNPTAIKFTTMDGDNKSKEENITQEQLESFLGCGYTVFMASVMCNQERVSSFINEPTDTGKAKIFGDMLGCAILDQIRKKIQNKKNEKQVAFETICAKADLLSEQLEAVRLDMQEMSYSDLKAQLFEEKAELAEAESMMDKLEQRRKSKLSLFQSWNAYEGNLKGIAACEERLDKLRWELKGFKEVMLDSDIDAKMDSIVEKRKKFDDIRSDLAAKKRSLDSEVEDLKRLMKMNGECPTCGTRVGEQQRLHFHQRIQSLEKLIEENSIKLNEIQLKIKQALTYYHNLQDKLDIYDENQRKKTILLAEIEGAEKNLALLKRGVKKPSEPKPDLNIINENINEAMNRVFNLTKGIESIRKVLKDFRRLNGALEEANEIVRKREKVYDIYMWLFQHLPLMKLKFLNENKLQLEDIINEYLINMEVPFYVKIDTQKEMKSTKEFKDSFSFQIFSTTNKKADRKDLSGGEKTCVLLATQFGINDVGKVNLGFEIYDEIYGSLDSKNIAVVIEALKNRAMQKQLFTISHDPEISNSFDKVVRVVKREGCSYVRAK